MLEEKPSRNWDISLKNLLRMLQGFFKEVLEETGIFSLQEIIQEFILRAE